MAAKKKPPAVIAKPEDIQRLHTLESWLEDRQRGRTDLMFLCREILGYKDFNETVHGPVFEHLQKFRGCEEYIDPDTLSLVFSEPICAWHSASTCSIPEHINSCKRSCKGRGCKSDCVGRSCWALDGPRFRTLFDPRGHLKTTGNTISHSIQWVINFRDIRIGLCVFEAVFGGEVISEIESHFRSNDKFRFVYPEFCPPGHSASRWGTLDAFTVPCRRKKYLKEQTVKVVAKGQAAAGPHHEVMKFCDLVNKENAYTDGGLRDVKRHFRFCMPLLERGPQIPGRELTRGWVDLEGTIYNNSDLYVEQMEKDDKRIEKGKPGRWAIFKRDAVKDERVWKKALKGEEIPSDVAYSAVLWPQRFPLAELLAIREDMDEFTFNCQYRLNPYAKSRGLATRAQVINSMIPSQMPLSSGGMRNFKKEMMARYWTMATFDLAGMDEESQDRHYQGGGDDEETSGEKSNSAGVVVGHVGGNMHVLDAMIGRMSPVEIIETMFVWWKKYKLQYIKVEKNHHAEIVMPFLTIEMEKRGIWMNVVAIPRDTSSSKDNRIWGLQPLFRRNLIRFYDDVPHMEHIYREIEGFPYYKLKDFLDALSDQKRDEKGGVDGMTLPQGIEEKQIGRAKFMGWDKRDKIKELWSDSPQEEWYGSIDDERIIGVL